MELTPQERELGRMLGDVMKGTGQTYDDVARELGVNRSFVSHLVSGRRLPSLRLYRKLCALYPRMREWLV